MKEGRYETEKAGVGGGGRWGREVRQVGEIHVGVGGGEKEEGGKEEGGKEEGGKEVGGKEVRKVGPEEGRRRMSGKKRMWYKQFKSQLHEL